MGRIGARSGRAQAWPEGRGRNTDRALQVAHRRLQVPAQRRLRRGAAAVRRRQGIEDQAARALLGRPRTASGLRTDAMMPRLHTHAWMDADVAGFREQVRRYVRSELTPRLDGWRCQGYIPREVWKPFGAMGYLLPELPEVYG